MHRLSKDEWNKLLDLAAQWTQGDYQTVQEAATCLTAYRLVRYGAIVGYDGPITLDSPKWRTLVDGFLN